jgi:polyisoprenoid-binding protein YceI
MMERRSKTRYSAATGAALMLCASAAFAARFDIDPIETRTTYETRYLGIIPVRGVFDRMTGVLHYEPTKPVAERVATIHVVIDATTLRPTTLDSDAKRGMLRGPSFFNVEKFPTIEFRSSKFRYEGEKLTAIDGQITIIGVQKPVTLTVLQSSCSAAAPPRTARCTAHTELVIKRSEFGMTGWSGSVSDEVKIAVQLVAVQGVEGASVEPKRPAPDVREVEAKDTKDAKELKDTKDPKPEVK